MRRVIAPLTVISLAAGCGPFIEVIKVDQPTAALLRTEIPVYGPEKLKDLEYTVLTPVEATSCKSKLWDDPATADDAMDQLRFKARAAQSNAIMNATCFSKEGMNTAKNCWQSVMCNGIGIQVRPR